MQQLQSTLNLLITKLVVLNKVVSDIIETESKQDPNIFDIQLSAVQRKKALLVLNDVSETLEQMGDQIGEAFRE